MDRIVLADGTAVENAYAVPSAGRLFFYIQEGATMLSACETMGDETKTAVIRCGEKEWRGYTRLFILQRNGDQISGGLERPE